MPGGHETLQDQRIPGLDEFVREYDAQRKAVDLLEVARSGDVLATKEALLEDNMKSFLSCKSMRNLASDAKEVLDSAAELEDKREILETVRDKLAMSLPISHGTRDHSALSKQFRRAVDELDLLPEPKADSPLEVARRGA